jgi:hypothetical protein
MNLIIYVNDSFEDERALFDLDNNKVLVMGDYYHDKIDEKIEGYLQALEDFDIHEGEPDTVWIEEDHKHYKLCFGV